MLRGGRVWRPGGPIARELAIAKGVVVSSAAVADARVVDLDGRMILPGLVNAHDHLDFSTFPALGAPPYASVYEWARDVDAGAGDPRVTDALAVPLVDRLFLGGVRNLLAGATAVAHHNAFHRSLARPGFPVRVLERYQFAHSPGLTPELRRTYRTTDRRIPWMVHAAEGTDERCRGELAALERENVLRQNTVIIHGIALEPGDAPRIAAARACLVWCPESNRRLYGATARVAELRAGGVRVGLGSDSPVSGVRDPLSNLAVARREGVMDDDALLALATRESGEVARLPAGSAEPGGIADLVVADDAGGLLAGDRRAVALVMVGGRPLYGDRALMAAALDGPVVKGTVEGCPRSFAGAIGRRTAALLAGARRAAWTEGVGFEG